MQKSKYKKNVKMTLEEPQITVKLVHSQGLMFIPKVIHI